ncbi:MAG: hypothetical protein IJ328_00775 [Muribaculaceae bacterium]|nr:hypothetical protein [Muribaculaceae bacterium]
MLSFDKNLREVTTLRPLLSYSEVASQDGSPKKMTGTISEKIPTGMPDECLRATSG